VQKVFKNVGLVARYDSKHALKLVEELSDYLTDNNITVQIEDTLTDKVKVQAKFTPLNTMNTDLLITIGGDGTILRACMAIPKPEPPILAINMGVRGFLTEIEPKGACAAIDQILKGDFTVEKCCKLSVSTGEDETPDGLNDVVVFAAEHSKVLYTQIFKNEQPVLRCQADGLIVATQTGSTGYSLSAGGPVLDKDVDGFVLTPICSLSVFRSIVFPADTKLTIKAIRPKEMLVIVDGRFKQHVTSENACLTIARSKNVTSFIRFKGDFYDRLRNRLLFKGLG
jgi:NAD+ kinase